MRPSVVARSRNIDNSGRWPYKAGWLGGLDGWRVNPSRRLLPPSRSATSFLSAHQTHRWQEDLGIPLLLLWSRTYNALYERLRLSRLEIVGQKQVHLRGRVTSVSVSRLPTRHVTQRALRASPFTRFSCAVKDTRSCMLFCSIL